MKLKKQFTGRGFPFFRFTEDNGVKCSIQKSSAAEDDYIWLGADEIGLKHFKANEGWKDVPLTDTIPEHYTANNRMHLTREQVKQLLPILTRFVKTGEI